MDSLSAFAMGEANRGKEMMVFDWNRAAELIRESGCEHAAAGLDGDWEWTGGCIFKNGSPNMEDYTYLSSTWATPQLEIDYGEICECYKMESEVPDWDHATKWPESALNILGDK